MWTHVTYVVKLLIDKTLSFHNNKTAIQNV
jgi:hypothetical protein